MSFMYDAMKTSEKNSWGPASSTRQLAAKYIEKLNSTVTLIMHTYSFMWGPNMRHV